MKFWELLPKTDCIEENIEETRMWLRDHPHVLTESAEHKRVVEFLKLHLSNSDLPTVGNEYYPVMILDQSFANMLSITAGKHGVLVKIDEQDKSYTFMFGDITKTIPEGERKSGDITQWGLLYRNNNDANYLISLIKLSFSDWHIKVKDF